MTFNALALELESNQKFNEILNRALSKQKSTFQSCTTPDPKNPSVANLAECQNHYLRLYSKTTVSVTLAFGYLDTRPFSDVSTPANVYNFIEMIRTPCDDDVNPHYDHLCGFMNSPDDSIHFFKEVSAEKSPDHKKHIFKITVVSAVPPNQAKASDNEMRKNPAQLKRSEFARQTYLRALQTDDVVIYNGHARDGGGPDFYPPVLTSLKTMRPNYACYRKKKPGLKDMIHALSTSKHHPEIIAMMACNSKQHFNEKLKRAAPESARLLTNMTVETNVNEVAQNGLLEGLMAQRCDDGFVQSMESGVDKVDNHPEKGKLPSVTFEGFGVTPVVPQANAF